MYKKIVGILIMMLFIGITIPQTGFFKSVKANPGDVILSFDFPGMLANGLTWDGNYLWVADYGRDKIYKIDVGRSEEESDVVIEEIKGGFGLNAKIVNNGTLTANNVNWSIDVELSSIGLILSAGHTDDMIDVLEAGGSKTIQAKGLRGIGPITINVQAADAVKQATAFLLGPLVLRVNEI